MTRKRYDEHSTEFGLWLREQDKIHSRLGYTATNLDYVWRNYKTGKWLLLEEKRFNGKLTYSQKETFRVLDVACKNDPNYVGFFLLVFENTSPDDGKMWLNEKLITIQELLDFLKLGAY